MRYLQLLKQLLPDAALIQDAFGPNWEADVPLDLIVNPIKKPNNLTQEEHRQLLVQLLPHAALIQDAFGPNWEENMPLDLVVELLPGLLANPSIPQTNDL